MKRALVLPPSNSMNETNCELAFIAPESIDTARALVQHAHYCQALSELGFELTRLPPEVELPDSVFIEDPVIILDEVAILTMPFSPSRKGEVPNIENTIAKLRPVARIHSPGTLEGGDVLSIGRILYVGLSRQTNAAGIQQLKEIVGPLGYEVIPVPVHGALHLKTAVTALSERQLLMNPNWIDAAPFSKFDIITVAEDEPFSANVITDGNRILMYAGFSRAQALVKERGFEVRTVDISEFLKADAGLTCMSVLYQ